MKKIKAKGKYWYPTDDKEYEGWWNKDFSNLSAMKGVEQCLMTGCKPEDIVRLITNPFDFMLRYKTQGDAKVYIGDREMLKTVRYYVSKAGEPMKKIAPPKGPLGQYKKANAVSDDDYARISKEIGPGVWDSRIHTKNKSKYEHVTTSIESGYLVKECNRAKNFNWLDVDFGYYIAEIQKLLIGVPT